MSEKMIAASTSSRATGCTVTSAARSGVLQSSRNEIFSRIARYSGRYLPACRIIQTGVVSTGSPRAARNRRSFKGNLQGCCCADIAIDGVGRERLVGQEGLEAG